MALANYANLKAEISGLDSFSHRDDFDDSVDDFILLAETEMYSNSDVSLRVKEMNATETSATSSSLRTQALPTGFLEPRRFDLTVSSERITIKYITPEAMYIRSGTGLPTCYTVTTQFEYDIIPDDTYVTNIIHYAKATALSDANTTNAILTNYPNVYLYGCLWAAFQWAENDENILKYRALFLSAIRGANLATRTGTMGVSTQRRNLRRNP